MPAYATQSAPKQAQGNPQQQKQPKQEAPKGLAALPGARASPRWS